MTRRALSIAQVNSTDEGGGAATVASSLVRGLSARGHRVRYVVGHAQRQDGDTVLLPDDDRPAYRRTGYVAAQGRLRRLAARHPGRGLGLLSRALRIATHPQVLADRLRGVEDLTFPASANLLEHIGWVPDVVHAHNLHGGFFDLRAVASISRQTLTVMTLHDMWLLTGHCAHALDCRRWQTGCGECPDLNLAPAVRRDATDFNWRRKQDVISQSRLHVAVPSRWLRDQVRQSLLARSVHDLRVIPNGIDTAVFTPGDRHQARAALGLPPAATVILLTTGGHGSTWKDDATLRRVMDGLASGRHREVVVFLAVDRPFAAGSRAHRVHAVPFVRDHRLMARYYQAADIYLHAARADTFPLSILEAMACATPVIATDVGGIAEQLVAAEAAQVRGGPEAIGDATGMLVPAAGATEMIAAVEALLEQRGALRRMGHNGARHVSRHFQVARQVDSYLSWYRDLMAAQQPAAAVV